MLKRVFGSWIGAGCLLAAGMTLLPGCSKGTAESHPNVPSVTVMPVEQKSLVEWSEFSGRTEPVESVEVRPRISGHIQEVRFRSGELVKKGDVLFVIDPRWHKAEYDRREAELARATVQLENARREAERTEQLVSRKAISVEEGDTRVSRFEDAKAALLAAEAALSTAKLDLEYTEVRAPIDGRVSRALITEGNYVSGLAGSASVLTTIVSVNPVYVYADVDEDSLLKFKALARENKLETDSNGQVPAELQLGDEQGFPHRGFIESFDNQLDRNTGSILLRAVFNNNDERIIPGLFARIRVPFSALHTVVLVPERAVGTDQAQKFVLTLTATNTVAYQSVELGPAVGNQRIVRSGLKGGESIVVNGMQRVKPGMEVKAEVAVAEVDRPRLAKR